ncbi:MAG: UDP-N-acetylmuramoyl-L-alanine--D-glutamate ligase [Patescibacteria group bacterium]
MNVVILGFGGQGKSSLAYWQKLGADVTVADSSSELSLPDGVTGKLGTDYLENLDQYDQIVRTPIIHPRQILEANPDSPNILDKVTSNTNEFFKVCPTKNIIGVTGTKGKGTTCTLITKMLEASGHTAHLIGNIGTPPLEVVDQIKEDDWVVMELANFQLIDLKYSPHIAVCVMVEPEHLDWHEDVDEYISAKQQLFIHQEESDIAIYYANNDHSEEIANASMGEIISYMRADGAYVKNNQEIWIDDQKICDTSEIKLIGKHNWQNICAAITAIWQIDQNVEAIRQVVTTIANLHYRLEFVREVDGVKFINDSFSSAPGACKAAINAISETKVIIIGGKDRMLDLDELCQEVVKNSQSIRKILIIGESKDRVAKELESVGFDNFMVVNGVGMSEIVDHAKGLAKPGDSVVLSPGFPSFDMFKNFEDRGDQFVSEVNAL